MESLVGENLHEMVPNVSLRLGRLHYGSRSNQKMVCKRTGIELGVNLGRMWEKKLLDLGFNRVFCKGSVIEPEKELGPSLQRCI